MDDDEINEIVARNDQEIEIFKVMDIEREKEEEIEWKASGRRGPKPDRLMQMHELPEVYQRDEPFVPVEEEEELIGRGRRVKNKPKYTDGITDEQWLNVCFSSFILGSLLTFRFRPSTPEKIQTSFMEGVVNRGTRSTWRVITLDEAHPVMRRLRGKAARRNRNQKRKERFVQTILRCPPVRARNVNVLVIRRQ